MDTRAVIYIASGEQYIDEARRSAKSINDTNSLPIIAYSPIFNEATETIPKSWIASFDIFGMLPNRLSDKWYIDSVHYLNYIYHNSQFDEILLLDTDTFICGDLSDFFKALDRFDIVGTHAVGRETMVQREDLPASFPELHIGAMAFRRNKRIADLFKLWLDIYQERPGYFGNNDQGPLREALWRSPEVKLGILPAEFCFRYRWGGLISGPVRVLHGRENSTPYEEIAKQVNSQKGIRVWHRRELA